MRSGWGGQQNTAHTLQCVWIRSVCQDFQIFLLRVGEFGAMAVQMALEGVRAAIAIPSPACPI
jgi:hypothetical protein